ncbi:MAG: hypothetical protein OXC18_06995 [Desulfurellaceae bacterium]|nr:hypothetical protein [Desulfurellaceae bacterium]
MAGNKLNGSGALLAQAMRAVFTAVVERVGQDIKEHVVSTWGDSMREVTSLKE